MSTPLQYCQTSNATCDETTTTIRQSNKTLSDSKSDNMLCKTEDVNTATTTLIKQSGKKNILDINNIINNNIYQLIIMH